jgi:disulfide bond formation protein DsbB
MPLTERTGPIQMLAAVAVLVGMTLTVGTALAFQHWGGFIPCALCLEQRTPYYVGIPIALFASAAAIMRGPALLVRGALFVIGCLMLWSAWLGTYHAGIEWGWWPGPADCAAVAAPVGTGGQGVLDQLDRIIPPSCDQAAGRFLSLSFAGWNVVASLVLAAIALGGVFARR